jgi:hypothetical protein
MSPMALNYSGRGGEIHMNFWLENFKGIIHLVGKIVDEIILLKCILKK